MRFASALSSSLLLILGCAPQFGSFRQNSAELTHGIAVGDVLAHSAVIWGRCDQPGTMSVARQIAASSAGQTMTTEVTPEHDLVGKVTLDGLQPGTAYTYRVWCGENEAAARSGGFSTAPAADRATAVRFAFGGDLGGQNVCRDVRQGYPVFHAIRSQSADFFIALGDLIYADDPCKPIGRYGNEQIPGPPMPALTRDAFRDYWKYNRNDPAFQQMLATTSMYSIWDDHEIKNDAGPSQDTPALKPDIHLLQPALDAYLEYQPMLTPADAATRFYSSRRWGKHLEVFILDLRQYRDANFAPDSRSKPKTMLGLAQRRWLLDALGRSDATWKVIVSSVPLSLPTGTELIGHDSWTGFGVGDGFEHEREMILEAMRNAAPRNFVWITTDVHFGAVFRYRPFADDDRFVFHEIVSGPLNAGIFPKNEYDRGLGAERLFMYGPIDDVADFDEALRWFNFGLMEIAADGALTAKLINGRNESVYALTLEPR
jgi:alkaline phosphatase D